MAHPQIESRVRRKREEHCDQIMSRDRDRGGDVARVYIGDLGSGGSKPELEKEFERYGPLKSVWVARNPPGMLLFRGLSPCPRLIFDTLTSL